MILARSTRVPVVKLKAIVTFHVLQPLLLWLSRLLLQLKLPLELLTCVLMILTRWNPVNVDVVLLTWTLMEMAPLTVMMVAVQIPIRLNLVSVDVV
jgi:hypothetical protein